MGSIPVANPSPPQRIGVSRRGAVLALSLVGLSALVALTVSFVWPAGSKVDMRPLQWVSGGLIDELLPWYPARYEVEDPALGIVHRFYVVRLPEATLALSTKDPHLGCTVPWRPDFELFGKKGWFRNPCHGETYDLTGHCVSGPCVRGLDRFPVRIEGSQVYVNVGRIILGPPQETGYQPVNPPQ